MYFGKMYVLGFTSKNETCFKNTQGELNNCSGSGITAQEDQVAFICLNFKLVALG